MTRLRLRLTPLEDRLAPSVSLVADINRQIVNADPVDPLVVVNGRLIFDGLGSSGGPATWRSDGTSQGTVPVPGVQVETNVPGVDFAGAHFFAGTNPASGTELWRTDGTPEGTRLVKNIRFGAAGSNPTHLTVAGGTLFFVVEGNQLWKSDGTSAGTVFVRSFRTPYPSDEPHVGPIVAVGDRVFFAAREGTDWGELWVSDGTTAGTRAVTNMSIGGWSADVMPLGAVGDEVLFAALPEGAGVSQLWKSDGTAAGTQLVRGDVRPFRPFATFGGEFFFVAADGELWKSDGTAAGTAMVKNIHPTGPSQPAEPVEYAGHLYFAASEPTAGREVWRTDGTEAGTVRVTDLIAGPTSSGPHYLAAGADGVYFAATDESTGIEVWKTDGTPGNAVLVADLGPGPVTSFPTWLTAGPGGVFWVANPGDDGPALYIARPDGSVERLAAAFAHTGDTVAIPGVTTGGVHYFNSPSPGFGNEPWRTDGTDAGTWMLKDIYPGPSSGFPTNFVEAGGTVYFSAADPAVGVELWATDGTPEGTRLVEDIEPSGNSSPQHLTAFQGKLIFTARTNADGRELWVSDGTADGTRMVKDLYPGPGDAIPFPVDPGFTEMNGYLYFKARDPVRGLELWRTDGTEGGTTLVTDLPDPWIGLDNTWNDRPERVGDRVVFWGQDAVDGFGLWATDGTPAGTTRLADVNASGWPRGRLGDRLLFWERTENPVGSNLWVTDGTPAGTKRLMERYEGGDIVAAGGLAYFTAGTNLITRELWATDGTLVGTRLVMTFPQMLGNMVTFNDRLYFAGHDLARGWGLWTSDGTTATTRQVFDPVTGPVPESHIPYPVVMGGSLFFNSGTVAGPYGWWSEYVPTHYTLWQSDGTTAGTRRVADGGLNEFVPFAEIDGVPLFRHDDGVHGSELWRYDPVVANPDTYTLEDRTRLDVPTASGVLVNDTDGPGLPRTAKLVTGPKSGWLTLRPDGSFSYRPFSNDFTGTDTFAYRAAGAVDRSGPTTVTIHVDLVNQAPAPTDDTASGVAGRALTVRVLANDADPDQDTLSVASFTQGASGRVTRMGGALVYTPRAGGPLTDAFTYTVQDKRGATATAAVTVHLAATAPPKVQAVRLFPGPGTGSVNLATLGNRSLPFGRLSRVEVTFTSNVSVSADDLRLMGAAGGAYALSGFAYDPARRTASWVIDGPATATSSDRLMFVVDGPSAAGVPVGTWARTVSLLVGDVDGNGLVTAADVAGVRGRFGAVEGTRRLFADLDGNGVVDAADVSLAAANLGTRRA